MQTDFISNLLTPIGPNSPCGESFLSKNTPAANSIHNLIDLRRTAKQNETNRANNGISQLIHSEDWKPVFTNSLEICANQSKDFAVISCFIEATTRIYNFEGLAQGLSLLKNLIEKYHVEYKNFYLEEPDDLLVPIEYLTGTGGYEGTLTAAVRTLPFTEAHETGPFALWQYNQAIELKNIADPVLKKQKIEKGALQFEQVQKVAAYTSANFVQKCTAAIEQSLSLCEELQKVINTYFPENNISFLQLKNILSECARMFNFVYEEKKMNSALSPRISSQEESSIPQNISTMPQDAITLQNDNTDLLTQIQLSTKNIPKTKFDILFAIEKIAKIYKELEPHSPVPYLLNKSLQWGKMELPEIFDELTSSNNQNFFNQILRGDVQ